uniref:Putative reverse transcriptase domain-containing protein n=1 Tax=Tanacetum cinerariifolium TaxID=118510 RepID=A0A6L2K3B0_TANCI|nr:putative reverse transcriptase domain-containing protein [Tanacetum cinerariifolium]
MVYPSASRSKIEGVFSPNIARPLHGVKLLGGPPSVDFDFDCELVNKRVAKAIRLMDAVAKINDPQCDLLLLRAYTALRCALSVKENQEKDKIGSKPDKKQEACRSREKFKAVALDHAQLALGSLRGIFMETMLYHAPVLLVLAFDANWIADVVPGRAVSDAAHRKMKDHTSDWLRVVSIFGLGQTMNGRTYRCVLCYRLGVPLFAVPKPCSTCSKVFAIGIYGDHVVSCDVGKEVDIGLGGGQDKPLCPTDMFLYSWDEGLDIYVNMTYSSPLTQIGMINFAPGHAVIEAAQRKCIKYEAKCADIEYGFLPISFFSFGELEKDAVTLLKRIQRFSVTQYIRARTDGHIFNRIEFVIARRVEAQIVSRLLTNFL